MIDWQRVFHVGVRVPDIERSMAELSACLDLTWAELTEREQAVWSPDGGSRTLHLLFTYSVDGPQHVELLQGPPGSIWHGSDAPGVHHVGIWTDDVGATAEWCVAAGWTLELAQRSPEDGWGAFAYVRSPGGFLLEPVSSSLEPAFEQWWAGGSL